MTVERWVPGRATDSSPALEVRGLTCRFGGTTAVAEVSFTVRRGEFFTLLGPSGCGKSTTLKAIGGFAVPNGGTILLGGKDVTRDPPAVRPTNYVFQSYALFPHLTVAQNLEYGLKRRGVPRTERGERIKKELARVSLSALGDRRPGQLSGGQQQRVALARALINVPEILLLDEPLSALDYTLRKQLRQELKRIQRDVGITTIFVTHDQGEALSMSDRIAVMNAGRIEQIGSPKDIYQRPASLFVARFIGDANLFRGRIAQRVLDTAVVDLDIGVRVQVDTATGAAQQRCYLIVRPEAIDLTPARQEGRHTIEATVQSSSYEGDRYSLHCVMKDGTPVAVVSRTPTEHAGTVFLSWRAEAAHLILESA